MSAISLHVRQLVAGGFLLAVSTGMGLVACSLNPQPIPPGEQPDATATVPQNPGGNDSTGMGDGAGGGGSVDAGDRKGDAAGDAPVGPPPQDAGDAGDASEDARNDAEDGGG